MADLIDRQQALDCFSDWIDRYGNEHTADEDATYQRIAELKGVESCDDTISRRAALEALADYIHMIDKTMGKGTLTEDDCMEAAKSVLGEDELPAVQPKPDCISRRKAIEAIEKAKTAKAPDGEIYVAKINAEMNIQLLPSVQPGHKWIPCRKKLPEKAGAYLVQALMNDDIFVARWEGCYWGVKTPIIAWRPLPAKYNVLVPEDETMHEVTRVLLEGLEQRADELRNEGET